MNIVTSIRPRDLLALAWSSLKRNKLRSSLTIGAIAFGIAVMMFLVSLGYGLERITLGGVENSPALLTLTINSANDKQLPLDVAAVHKISQFKDVKEVDPSLIVKGEVVLDHIAQITIEGVDPQYLQLDDNLKLLVGNYYRPDDTSTMMVSSGFIKQFGLDTTKNPSLVFGVNFSQEDFPGTPGITNVGVSGVINTPASVVYLPRPFLESVLGKGTPHYLDAKVAVNNLDNVEGVKAILIQNGFRVRTVSETVQQIKHVFSWIRYVLAVMGLVAIFVASIGMFNTLTISLLERTKEIGIMKALGVRKGDIGRLFLIESFIMGLLGGILGILGAIGLQQFTLFILSLIALKTVDSVVPAIFYEPWYIIVAFLVFSGLIASLTGIYPARIASALNPIDAIRYE
jgi:ABC-type antimicrobial peptide transport system permease subunit